jgi:hypothetical protein
MDWLVRDQAAADLLGILAEVGRIIAFQCWLSCEVGYWDSLPAKTKTAIISLCAAPSLSHLAIKSVPLLSVDFKAGPALKRMQLELDTKGYHTSQPPPPSTNPLVKLHTLTLLGTEETFDFAVGRIDLAHLRALKVVKDSMAEPTLGRVLALCHSLETLVTPSFCRFIRTIISETMLIRVDCESPPQSHRARPCLPIALDRVEESRPVDWTIPRGSPRPALFDVSLQPNEYAAISKRSRNHLDQKPDISNRIGIPLMARRTPRLGVEVCGQSSVQQPAISKAKKDRGLDWILRLWVGDRRTCSGNTSNTKCPPQMPGSENWHHGFGKASLKACRRSMQHGVKIHLEMVRGRLERVRLGDLCNQLAARATTERDK